MRLNFLSDRGYEMEVELDHNLEVVEIYKVGRDGELRPVRRRLTQEERDGIEEALSGRPAFHSNDTDDDDEWP